MEDFIWTNTNISKKIKKKTLKNKEKDMKNCYFHQVMMRVEDVIVSAANPAERSLMLPLVVLVAALLR